MKQFKTNFENWDDALYYGLSGASTEKSFKNWEFTLDYVMEHESGKWGSTHVSTEGQYYPESKVIYIGEDYTKEQLLKFKEYFDELYGKGLQVANWHQNGNLEEFDKFYESALECMEESE